MQSKTADKTINNERTIVAIATPVGMGGVAIVRFSGKNAFTVAARLLQEKGGIKPLQGALQTDRTMRLVELNARGVRDKVLCVFFYAPHSYTGENVVEIHAHGNYQIAETIIRAAVDAGAREAEAGEFTRRAFLNGKIDLTAAEGIADLIEAQGEAQLRAAFLQSEGALYQKINLLYERLIDLTAQAEAAIDYPEEELAEPTAAEIGRALKKIESDLKTHLSGYDGASLLREGVRTVICGDANVGKSKLMNVLLGRERAIVTPIAGTTRDTIEESFIYEGVLFLLCDTAGIRVSDDEVEKIGVERSKRALEAADLIVAVSEKGKPFLAQLPPNKTVIHVVNKSDLKDPDIGASTKDLNERALDLKNEPNTLFISALTGENINVLKEALLKSVKGQIAGGGARLNNRRQYEAALRAYQNVQRAILSVQTLSLDCVASDLSSAATDLGKITGRTACEDVVTQIFSRFCVGK